MLSYWGNLCRFTEVFNQFDELSFEFAKMNLSHYRQSAIGQEMMR